MGNALERRPVPLLKSCLNTMERRSYCWSVSYRQNALDCTILQSQSQHFLGMIHRTSANVLPVLGPRHQFPLGSPAFPTKRPLISALFSDRVGQCCGRRCDGTGKLKSRTKTTQRKHAHFGLVPVITHSPLSCHARTEHSAWRQLMVAEISSKSIPTSIASATTSAAILSTAVSQTSFISVLGSPVIAYSFGA